MSIKLFDTTLRDGTQREGVSLTAEDKARIARELDSLGIHYIEAGFPASNPKDLEFFEGFDDDPAYALAVLRAAAEAGATTLVLCDTNGGTLPTELKAVVARTVREFPDVEVGIHTHNDSGCGVANALVAVEAGTTHVQGTVNGVGERTGNCDLVTTIANLQLKMGLKVVDDEKLRRLTETSNYVAELMNLTPDTHRPYVGRSAFAHKGGLHVDGISRDSRTYEHVAPERVGNVRRTPIGELSGKNSIRTKAEELGLEPGDVA